MVLLLNFSPFSARFRTPICEMGVRHRFGPFVHRGLRDLLVSGTTATPHCDGHHCDGTTTAWGENPGEGGARSGRAVSAPVDLPAESGQIVSGVFFAEDLAPPARLAGMLLQRLRIHV